MIFLFIFVWILYYSLKGIYFKEIFVRYLLFFINISLFFLLYSIALGFSSYGEIFLILYLILSLFDYILFIFFDKKIIIKYLFSSIYMNAGEVKIKYTVFRPLILLVLNIYLIFNKNHLLGFKDTIDLGIKSADGTEININI